MSRCRAVACLVRRYIQVVSDAEAAKRIALATILVCAATAYPRHANALQGGVGKHYYVDPQGDNSNDGVSPNTPFRNVQKAVDLAQPGDVIELAPGIYLDDIVSRRDGMPGAPITVTGPLEAIVKGDRSWVIIRIRHDYMVLQGFTVDGLHGLPDSPRGFRNKLLYAMSEQPLKGVTGIRILGMTIKNAGAECLRLRYFAQRNEVAESTFLNCGVWDYRFRQGSHVGEAVYIGTHPDQLGMFEAPTSDPDRSSNNWIHHNVFNTQGSECVDIKHSSSGNLVEYNKCTGEKDPDYPGISVLGDANVIRHNEVFGNTGAGIRLGGDYAGIPYGKNNNVYDNVIRNNLGGGIRFMTIPQGKVCGNTMAGNRGGDAGGRYASQFKPTARCN